MPRSLSLFRSLTAVSGGARLAGLPPVRLPRPASAARAHRLAGVNANVLVCAALCMVVGITWLPRLQGPLDLRWDAGAYYVLGTSLAEGRGYRLLNEPGEIEAIQYPPGLPLLVAAHQWVLGTAEPHVVGFGLRVSFLVIGLATAVAAFALLRRFLPLPLAGLGALLGVLVSGRGDELMAEQPFGLAVLLFVLFTLRSGRLWSGLGGLCAVAAYLLRTAGVAVLLAWVVESAIRRRWRSFACRLLVAAVPVLAWQGHAARVQSDPAYTQPAYEYQRAAYLFNNVTYATNLRLKDPFIPELGTASTSELIWRSARTLPHLPLALGEVVSANWGTWEMVFARAGLRRLGGGAPTRAGQLVLVAFGGLTLLGVAVLMRRRQHLLGLLLVATIATVCATPWTVHWGRYLGPLAPLFVLAALLGARALGRRLRLPLPPAAARGAPHLFVAAVALVLVVNLAGVLRVERRHHQRVEYRDRDGSPIAYRLYHYRDGYRAFDAGLDWLREHAGPSDIVATTMPYWVYLRTGLRAVLPPAEVDADEVLRLLETVPATFVIAGGSTAITWARQYVYPALQAAPELWEPIYASPEGEVVIYQRLLRSPPAGEPTDFEELSPSDEAVQLAAGR